MRTRQGSKYCSTIILRQIHKTLDSIPERSQKQCTDLKQRTLLPTIVDLISRKRISVIQIYLNQRESVSIKLKESAENRSIPWSRRMKDRLSEGFLWRINLIHTVCRKTKFYQKGQGSEKCILNFNTRIPEELLFSPSLSVLNHTREIWLLLETKINLKAAERPLDILERNLSA